MGSSRNFDADTEVINCGSAAVLDNIFDGGGTIMAWIYINEDIGSGRFLAKEGSLIGWQFYYRSSTNVISFLQYFTTNYRREDTTTVNINEWIHCAATYNSNSSSNRPSMYLNGILNASTIGVSPSGSRQSDAAQSFCIGNNTANNGPFRGLVCYAQAFDRILSAAEINEAMIRPGSIRTNLVGYWPCLGSDSPERDLSGNGNTGTVTGATESFNGPPVRLF